MRTRTFSFDGGRVLCVFAALDDVIWQSFPTDIPDMPDFDDDAPAPLAMPPSLDAPPPFSAAAVPISDDFDDGPPTPSYDPVALMFPQDDDDDDNDAVRRGNAVLF